jgi:hypothetical protein
VISRIFGALPVIAAISPEPVAALVIGAMAWPVSETEKLFFAATPALAIWAAVLSPFVVIAIAVWWERRRAANVS